MKPCVVGAIVVLTLYAATIALGAHIIDAKDDDWVVDYASENIDGDDAPIPQYDIYVNRSTYENDYWYFYYRTMDYYPTGNIGDFSEIYIDADMNSNTGGTFATISGFDYKLRWNLGGRHDEEALGFADLYAWDPNTGEYEATGNTYAVARGLAANTGVTGKEMFTEWSLPGSAIGNPTNLLWGARLDDYGTSADDLCPDELDQPGTPTTPELPPVTLLLSFGGVAIALFRQHRAK